jgi:hypothetical protein
LTEKHPGRHPGIQTRKDKSFVFHSEHANSLLPAPVIFAPAPLIPAIGLGNVYNNENF